MKLVIALTASFILLFSSCSSTAEEANILGIWRSVSGSIMNCGSNNATGSFGGGIEECKDFPEGRVCNAMELEFLGPVDLIIRYIFIYVDEENREEIADEIQLLYSRPSDSELMICSIDPNNCESLFIELNNSELTLGSLNDPDDPDCQSRLVFERRD